VVGGLTIGGAEVMAKVHPGSVPALGAEFGDIVPYLIMLIILLVRPFGLFGTPEVRRSDGATHRS
jgi:branched-chain amino acid transport system permease protein